MMPNWLRVVLAVVAGFVVWFVVATVGNLAIRWLIPGYAEVEKTMDFSLGMMLARLALGAVSSFAAGAACGVVGRGASAAVYPFAFLLIALFVPVHVNLWARFPLWYHVVFLGSLVPLAVWGARFRRSRRSLAA